MSIDRIGKGSGVPPATVPTAPSKTSETGKVFEVRAPTRAEAVPGIGSSPLEQLKAGKLDVDGYVQAKIDEATAHLQGVPPVQLESVRTMLRDHLTSDPALSDLLGHVTAQTPKLEDE